MVVLLFEFCPAKTTLPKQIKTNATTATSFFFKVLNPPMEIRKAKSFYA